MRVGIEDVLGGSECDGDEVGCLELEGIIEAVGSELGWAVGRNEGMLVGPSDGKELGMAVGIIVCSSMGFPVG